MKGAGGRDGSRPQREAGRRSAQPIGELLKAFLTTSGAGRVVAREVLEEGWRAAVGPEVAGETRVRGLRDGVLTVEVTSSALLQELATFYRASILATLRQREGPFREVRELSFKVG